MSNIWDSSLNTQHISNALDSYEAARSAFFTLIINFGDDLVSPTYAGENPVDSDKIIDGQGKIRLNVTQCPVPHFSVGTSEYRRGNDVVKFATTPSWSDGTIVVDDVVGINTKDVLMSWLYQAYNPHTRKGGRMAKYKKTATLCEYTQDYELIRTWRVEGAFITSLSESNFDRESDNKRQISATIVFDRALVVDDNN